LRTARSPRRFHPTERIHHRNLRLGAGQPQHRVLGDVVQHPLIAVTTPEGLHVAGVGVDEHDLAQRRQAAVEHELAAAIPGLRRR
jgi:hypothetical protein